MKTPIRMRFLKVFKFFFEKFPKDRGRILFSKPSDVELSVIPFLKNLSNYITYTQIRRISDLLPVKFTPFKSFTIPDWEDTILPLLTPPSILDLNKINIKPNNSSFLIVLGGAVGPVIIEAIERNFPNLETLIFLESSIVTLDLGKIMKLTTVMALGCSIEGAVILHSSLQDVRFRNSRVSGTRCIVDGRALSKDKLISLGLDLFKRPVVPSEVLPQFWFRANSEVCKSLKVLELGSVGINLPLQVFENLQELSLIISKDLLPPRCVYGDILAKVIDYRYAFIHMNPECPETPETLGIPGTPETWTISLDQRNLKNFTINFLSAMKSGTKLFIISPPNLNFGCKVMVKYIDFATRNPREKCETLAFGGDKPQLVSFILD